MWIKNALWIAIQLMNLQTLFATINKTQNEVYYFIAYTIVYKFGFGNIFLKTFMSYKSAFICNTIF